VSALNGTALAAELRQIPVGLIDTDGKNLRREQGDVSGLQGSLTEVGMLQPITVRPIGDRFEVVAGHRRLAAAVRAGYSAVPCIVRDMDDRTKWVMRVGENLHRKNLTPSEEGRLYQQLCIEGYTQREIARMAGCSQAHVSIYLKILEWPPRIVRQVDLGEITLQRAQQLASGRVTLSQALAGSGAGATRERDGDADGRSDKRVLNIHTLEEMARFFRTIADDEWANGAVRSKARQLLRVATQALGAEQVGGGLDEL
jgi:ParB family chromosome partitioning protein